MSYKARLIRLAIKLTPNMLIMWAANIVLKDIAKLTHFSFDLDRRKVYVQTMLYGETEPIVVALQNFAVIGDGESYRFILQQAQSNRPWLTNLLSHFVGRAWKIPVTPQSKPHVVLLAELLRVEGQTGKP